MDNSKTPLCIYLIFKEEYLDGNEYSEIIISQLMRDFRDPLNRSIGIPVLVINNYKYFDEIVENTKAAKNVFIILIDDYLVADIEFKLHIEKLNELCNLNSESNLIIPVALSKFSLNFSTKLAVKNFVRLFEIEEIVKRKIHFLFIITQEICRFLYEINRISETNKKQISYAPIKLFISHAKEDGKLIAKQIHNFISSNTPLDAFFDSNDIATGYDFENEIIGNIDSSVLLVIQTDKYSTREWCRKEILVAKKYKRPIIVLNALKKGEHRSFPYMSNVRTLRVEDDLNIPNILTDTLLETLRFKYQNLFLQYFANVFKLKIDSNSFLSNPPELLTLLNLEISNNKDIVYPDPPLSEEELQILKNFNNKIRFLTPTLIPLIKNEDKDVYNLDFLNNLKIGISISESENLKDNGFSFVHISDFMNELARYFLILGSELTYGGDLGYSKEQNFLDILTDLVKSYNSTNRSENKVINFVSSEIYNQISPTIRAKFINTIKFVEVIPWDYVNKIESNNEKLKIALNLSKLRSDMNNYVDARIIIGGKISSFMGFYPGLLEEAILAINSRRPVFIIGAFGGISKLIIDCISHKISKEDFVKSICQNKNLEILKNQYILYKNVVDFNYQSLESIYDSLYNESFRCLNNGLNTSENEKLFTSSNIVEIITLIFRGLNNLQKGRSKNE